MSDDLVNRLRDVAGVIIGAQSQNLEEDYGLAREAADRIEKLEAALREIVSLHHDHGAKAAEDIYVRDGMTFDIAHKALEGKDD